MTTSVVFIAGPMPPLELCGSLSADSPEGKMSLGDRLRSRIEAAEPKFLVAADGGLDLAVALGFEPEFVVGDMDSVTPSVLDRARESTATVTEVPRAKDASDYELALDIAMSNGADHVVVVGGASGRLDHVFATILTLTSPKYSRLTREAWLVDSYLAVISGSDAESDQGDTQQFRGDVGSRSSRRAVICGSAGDHVSIFAVTGNASGVTTHGLRWALDGSTLAPGSSLGVSNEMLGPRALVEVDRGTLAIFKAVDSFPASPRPLVVAP